MSRCEFEVMTFDSVSDCARWVKSTPRPKGSGNSSEANRAAQDWDLGLGYDAAMSMALAGGLWEEGARKMMSANVRAARALADREIVEPEYDVCGGALDVPVFLSGDPECFDVTDHEHTGPVLTVGVSVIASCNVTAAAMFARGAAILSVIDALESTGQRVELYAVSDTQARDDRGNYADSTRILIKRAGEQWLPASAAFALAHPAMSRRLTFATMERHTSERVRRLTSFNYGIPGNATRAAGEFGVYFDSMLGWSAYTENPAEALIGVLESFESQAGVKL